ncbi:MAG: hypothetical protein K2O91_00110 [Lachnospiraceae bacterium]|nr:hypothetical protein [Lachnospiraceae bacterium]
MTRQDKIDIVRNNVITNAQTYSSQLAGRYYLYIFENHCFEMYYGIDNYLHLTGVGTYLSPSQFYSLAKSGHLQSSQMYFNQRFPLSTAMKKSDNLKDLGNFVSEGYFIIKDFATDTCIYPYAITNIDQSVLIGLKQEEIEEIYVPKSFRVKGNIFDKSTSENIFEIQYILCKIDMEEKYDTILYGEESNFNDLDESIKERIDEKTLKGD